MSVVNTLLKARMDVKDDEMPKLDQLENEMQEQFKQLRELKYQIDH